MRLAVDKIMLHGLRSLEAQGFEIMEGEEVTEKCRSVKGEDEILAMRCASEACENAVAIMEKEARAKYQKEIQVKMIFGLSYMQKTLKGVESGLKRVY